jgi:methylenetetrahydrofolate dehydrogenase (NADP+)/methenyltetrahydrofolate cyclohydrolase
MIDKIIDGKKIANELCDELAVKAEKLKKDKNIVPGLAVILVGNDPASAVYVANKNKKAKLIGINGSEILLSEGTSQVDLLLKIKELNEDDSVHGILVQLPLPKHINKDLVINSIDSKKDVDGFNIENVGRLYTKQECFVPCTPQGCMILIEKVLGKDLSGKKAVVFGRSDIVGKPMAELLLQANCTVTILHSRSNNAKEESLKADIIVAAIGKPKFIDSSYVKEGAVIIDVGINRIVNPETGKGKLVGDVDFEDCFEKAKAITPVPGGVGPMTIACLMLNTYNSALRMG